MNLMKHGDAAIPRLGFLPLLKNSRGWSNSSRGELCRKHCDFGARIRVQISKTDNIHEYTEAANLSSVTSCLYIKPWME